MRTPKIVFETRTFELKKASAKEFLDALEEYFKNATIKTNPGDEGFVSGKENFNQRTFIVFPIISGLWNSSLMISSRGIVRDKDIKVDFQASALSFIIPCIFYLLFISVFISKAWISIVWLTMPALVVLMILNIVIARKQYEKGRQNHIDFLNKLDFNKLNLAIFYTFKKCIFARIKTLKWTLNSHLSSIKR